MKKILLATTAVVALSTVSAQAFAADKIKLELGGFMKQYVGLANNDEVSATAGTVRSTDLQQFTNSEVYFRGNTKTDNGLTVAVDVQMETSTRNGQGATARKFDVVSMEISSDAIGAVSIGSTTHALDDFQTRAPQASGLDWGDMANNFNMTADVAGTASANASASAGIQMDDTGSKGQKLKYVSPNFSGVNVFGSYAANEHDNQTTQTSAGSDAYSYGIAFGGEVGGASISADVIRSSNVVAARTDVNHVGLSVGMAGFTVGAGYSDFNDNQDTSASTATTSDTDGTGFEIGVAYETGPISASVGYAVVKTKGDTATAGDNKDTSWAVAGGYSLGAGVALTATYYSQKFDAEGTGTTIATGKSVTSKGFIAGVEVGF